MRFETLLSTLLLVGGTVAAPTLQNHTASFDWNHDKIRGVNIGGWLVLEPWITPSIFEPHPPTAGIIDEYTLCQHLGASAAHAMLQPHWDTFVTPADFHRLARAGFNLVRIPIGFWAFDPRHTPYVPGAAAYLDRALGWARDARLKVMVDLHGAPRSQNGYDNSGRRREHPGWTRGDSVPRTLAVLRQMAARYAGPEHADVVMGIELLNEPAGFALDMDVIRRFYQDGYEVVRRAGGAAATVLLHDAFQPPSSFNGLLTPATGAQDVAVDHHYYQVFTVWQNQLSHEEHIQQVCKDTQLWTGSDKRTIIGEWSGAMTDCAQWLNGYGRGARYDGTYENPHAIGSCAGINDLAQWSPERRHATRRFIAAQMAAFERTAAGWVWWNFKTERSPEWDALQLIEAGIFPELDFIDTGNQVI